MEASFPATTLSTPISTSSIIKDTEQNEVHENAETNDYQVENSTGFLTSLIAYLKLVNEGKINVNIKL